MIYTSWSNKLKGGMSYWLRCLHVQGYKGILLPLAIAAGNRVYSMLTQQSLATQNTIDLEFEKWIKRSSHDTVQVVHIKYDCNQRQ